MQIVQFLWHKNSSSIILDITMYIPWSIGKGRYMALQVKNTWASVAAKEFSTIAAHSTPVVICTGLINPTLSTGGIVLLLLYTTNVCTIRIGLNLIQMKKGNHYTCTVVDSR